MTKTKKTILGAILCVAMVLCLSVGAVLSMPTKAFADEGGFGIILGDETPIYGQQNKAQDEFLEYVIVADLTAGTTFQLRNFGIGVSWTEHNIDEDSTSNLTINEGDVYEVTADGQYTIYLYMYGYNDNKVFVSYNAPASQYHYTSYANWQIKYGNTWEWTDNLETVEEGLYKIEIYWEGTGINVKSDNNPILKDWFAPEELTMGEEVIAPVNVDVYLRVIDDETLMIGIGVIPTAPTPAVTDYYLVGYIDNAYYGIESDIDNFGDYHFVDGKVTATFTYESYVQVKDNNKQIYGTESFIIPVEECSGIVSATDIEKMGVGVGEYEFTLSIAEDGTMTLSYALVTTTYTISDGTAQDANGSISFDKETAEEGEPVTVTVTPSEGYQLKSLTAVAAVMVAVDVCTAWDM